MTPIFPTSGHSNTAPTDAKLYEAEKVLGKEMIGLKDPRGPTTVLFSLSLPLEHFIGPSCPRRSPFTLQPQRRPIISFEIVAQRRLNPGGSIETLRIVHDGSEIRDELSVTVEPTPELEFPDAPDEDQGFVTQSEEPDADTASPKVDVIKTEED